MQQGQRASMMIIGKALLGEVLGTMILFSSGMFANLGYARNEVISKQDMMVSNPVIGALSTGFAVTSMMYAFADVSGAHLNPAVTVSFMLTRKIDVWKGFYYIFAQLVGGIFAVLLVWTIFPDSNGYLAKFVEIKPGPDSTISQVFLMEFMLTFILVYAIFAIAFDNADYSTKKTVLPAKRSTSSSSTTSTNEAEAAGVTVFTASGHSKAGFAPLSIGFLVASLCLIGGSVSGGAFNPSRAFCAALLSWDWRWHHIYWIADIMGGALGAFAQMWITNTSR